MSALRVGLLAAATAAAMLSVWLINGAPLIYVDSGAYLKKGQLALAELGLSAPLNTVAVETLADAPGEALPEDVDASRSIVYSLALTIVAMASRVSWMVLLQGAVIVLTVGLAARVLARVYGLQGGPLTLLALLAGSAGALPFYVAFLMPDFATAPLILALALLGVFAGSGLHRTEAALAVLICVGAASLHLSHLALVVAMLPLVACAALLLSHRGRWIPVLLVGLVVVGGVVERQAFALSVTATSDRVVSYMPFLTSRLIDDGPGLHYLEARCPDPTIASCALYAELQSDPDPARLRSYNILFAPDERGSFKHLSEPQKAAISAEQQLFALSVLRADPLGVAGAFAQNVGEQLARFSVSQAVGSPKDVAQANDIQVLAPDLFKAGRLVTDRSWLTPVEQIHSVVYAASALVLLAALVCPGALDARMRGFVLLILAGILVNAVVCGGLSTPADRYGARVMWLLPLTAVMASMVWRARAASPSAVSGLSDGSGSRYV